MQTILCIVLEMPTNSTFDSQLHNGSVCRYKLHQMNYSVNSECHC